MSMEISKTSVLIRATLLYDVTLHLVAAPSLGKTNLLGIEFIRRFGQPTLIWVCWSPSSAMGGSDYPSILEWWKPSGNNWFHKHLKHPADYSGYLSGPTQRHEPSRRSITCWGYRWPGRDWNILISKALIFLITFSHLTSGPFIRWKSSLRAMNGGRAWKPSSSLPWLRWSPHSYSPPYEGDSALGDRYIRMCGEIGWGNYGGPLNWSRKKPFVLIRSMHFYLTKEEQEQLDAYNKECSLQQLTSILFY